MPASLMEVTEIAVNSLGELVDRVTPVAPDSITERWRTSCVYHGSGNAGWPLLTSLDRLGGVTPPHTKVHLEAHVLRHFLRYGRPYLPSPSPNDWELLVAAQHHGVPTRLLDWSYSPLIAAHFATLTRDRGSPAAIWQLDWQQLHQAFNLPPFALLITDMERLFGETKPFTPWNLFDMSGERKTFAFLLEPPALDVRLITQSATFTLCSDATQPFERFLEQHGLSHTLTKFVIPAQHVPRVRDQLDLVGIDERRLFPDLDGVAAETRRYYT
jgi:hypothetical protein